jgi:hypothetical protein
MARGAGAGGGDVDVAGGPCEIKRNERAEQMPAVDGAQPVGEEKVEDNTGPEALGMWNTAALATESRLSPSSDFGGSTSRQIS